MNLTETERLVRRIESYLRQPDMPLDPDVNKKDIFGLTPLDAVNHIDLNSRDRGELEKKPQKRNRRPPPQTRRQKRETLKAEGK